MEITIKAVIEFLTTSWATALANVSSILGLIVTIIVMLNVWNIRKHYASLVRVPELQEQLDKHRSRLLELLNDYTGNTDNINLELTGAETVLVALKKRLRWSEGNTVKEALENIRQFFHEGSSEDLVREVHRLLHKINGELHQRDRDSRLEA